MNIKNTFKNTAKNTAGIASLVGIVSLYSCTSDAPSIPPNDSPEYPYISVPLNELKRQQEGAKVIVEGDLKNIEDERIIMESKLYMSSILRNDFYISTGTPGTTQAGISYAGVNWESLVSKLRPHIKNPLDTTNLYNSHIKVYGIVNSDGMLEMRFIEMDNKLYDAFK